jgi:hypothetical protein
MSSKPTRVYILGAGCSVCGGYPLASEVPVSLRQFSESLVSNDQAQQLRKCVEDTVVLLDQFKVQTTDQLAQVLGEDRRPEIEMSKKAMSALFFSLEDEAAKRALPNYSAFFEELFEQGDDPEMEARVKATNCRVLTYNYDRLFERTFIEWIKSSVEDHPNRDQNSVNWLNSSLRNPSRVEIARDSFALVKLHGGIGQFFRNGDYGKNYIYLFDLWEKLPPIKDDPYFEKSGQKSNEQTIFYPTDKRPRKERKAEAGSLDSSLRAYEDHVWDVAEEFTTSASEIQIIGYSMQPIDWFWFKDLFRDAKGCRKIVVRNRRECLGYLVEKMERLGNELGIEWKVEGRVEDFFGRPQS